VTVVVVDVPGVGLVVDVDSIGPVATADEAVVGAVVEDEFGGAVVAALESVVGATVDAPPTAEDVCVSSTAWSRVALAASVVPPTSVSTVGAAPSVGGLTTLASSTVGVVVSAEASTVEEGDVGSIVSVSSSPAAGSTVVVGGVAVSSSEPVEASCLRRIAPATTAGTRIMATITRNHPPRSSPLSAATAERATSQRVDGFVATWMSLLGSGKFVEFMGQNRRGP
jgi:hypothetical protein